MLFLKGLHPTGKLGEKVEAEISSDIYYREASDFRHNTGDDEDKDRRPAKRQRLSPTRNGLTLSDELAPNGNHLPSRTSQSPYITVESALIG